MVQVSDHPLTFPGKISVADATKGRNYLAGSHPFEKELCYVNLGNICFTNYDIANP